MSKIKPDFVVKELKKRAAAAQKAAVKPFRLEDFCFDKQLGFITDPARFKTAVCSRRSGKTIACAADLVYTAINLPGDVAYITLSRRSAKNIIWRELIKLNKEYNLNFKVDNVQLTMTAPAGNMIHLSGAKDESEMEKLRGMSLRKVYIDEAQSFRPYIEEMIHDIITPALTDYYGSLVLIGTPGPVPAGFFYDISHNSTWSHHHWTMQDNPHIKIKSRSLQNPDGKDPLDIIKETAAIRGLTIDSPSILREYFGQWVKDVNGLVYQFDPVKNITTEFPKDLTYVLGVDIGFKDADAIAVLGYSHELQSVFLVEEFLKTGQDITALAQKIGEFITKYNPVKIVMDAGALGTKIQDEIRRRHSLSMQPAEKARKNEFIALLNDDLRTSKLKTFAGSTFEKDSYLLQWDFSVPERPRISDNFHSDICDAVLYAWRECNHFYERDSKPEKPTADEYMKALEEKEAEAMELAKNNGNDFTDVNSWNDLSIGDDYADDF